MAIAAKFGGFFDIFPKNLLWVKFYYQELLKF